MTQDEHTVRRFYECLTRNDAAGMAECSCDEATSEDMAFDLTGKGDIDARWPFECSPGLAVTYRDIRTEGSAVKGHWG